MITCTKRDSENKKLGGGVRATYRKVDQTCPQECQFLQDGGGCYAMRGSVKYHADKSEHAPHDGQVIREYLEELPLRKKVRHHISGDFFVEDEPDEAYIRGLLQGHQERPDLQGWTYTHGWERLRARRLNAPRSLTVNASCDSLEAAQRAKDQGWPVTVVLPEDSDGDELPDGTRVVVCPAQTHDISCAECQLCMNSDREAVVGFRQH